MYVNYIWLFIIQCMFHKYMDYFIIREWIRIREPYQMIKNLFVDALTCILYFPVTMQFFWFRLFRLQNFSPLRPEISRGTGGGTTEVCFCNIKRWPKGKIHNVYILFAFIRYNQRSILKKTKNIFHVLYILLI